jgi:hypothetical protein
MGVSIFKMATETTASGIAVLMVRPTLNPRYALALPKTAPKNTPRMTVLGLKSFIFVSGGT